MRNMKRGLQNKRTQEQKEYLTQICDTCIYAKWVTDLNHQDHAGKPICLSCPEQPYIFVRGRKACDKWKPKSEKNGRIAK